MVTNPEVGKEYICIGHWTNPKIEKVSMTRKVLSQYEVTPEKPSGKYCVWPQQLFEYSEKSFSKLERKILFYRKRENRYKKYFENYWDTYENSISLESVSIYAIYFHYYCQKTSFGLKHILKYVISPILNIFFLDISVIFQYSPKFTDSKLKINQIILEIEHAKTDWIYKDQEQERIKEIKSLEEKLKEEETYKNSIIKILGDTNKTIITASLSILALIVSFFTFFTIYNIKNHEIDKLTENINKLKTEIDLSKQKNLDLNMEKILLESKIYFLESQKIK